MLDCLVIVVYCTPAPLNLRASVKHKDFKITIVWSVTKTERRMKTSSPRNPVNDSSIHTKLVINSLLIRSRQEKKPRTERKQHEGRKQNRKQDEIFVSSPVLFLNERPGRRVKRQCPGGLARRRILAFHGGNAMPVTIKFQKRISPGRENKPGYRATNAGSGLLGDLPRVWDVFGQKIKQELM